MYLQSRWIRMCMLSVNTLAASTLRLRNLKEYLYGLANRPHQSFTRTELFENTLQNGGFWKRRPFIFVWTKNHEISLQPLPLRKKKWQSLHCLVPLVQCAWKTFDASSEWNLHFEITPGKWGPGPQIKTDIIDKQFYLEWLQLLYNILFTQAPASTTKTSETNSKRRIHKTGSIWHKPWSINLNFYARILKSFCDLRLMF